MILDRERNTVANGRREVRFSPTQFVLLMALTQSAGKRLSVPQLIHAGWGHDPRGGPDCAELSIRTHIHAIRRKLRSVASPARIENVWGQGYVFIPAKNVNRVATDLVLGSG